MHTKFIHFKLKIDCIAMGVLALCLGAPVTQAAPANNIKSPYRLNVKPIELPQVSEQPSVVAPTSPQIYQLEYKYRSHKTPLKTKPEPPPPSSLTVRYLDTSEMYNDLADQPFSKEIALAAQAAALDPSLVHAVIYVESKYRPKAVSAKGAVGLMQVMPDTAARYGLKHAVYIPKENIKAGTLYLRDLMVMFDNRLDLVLAAYNAGENAVKRHSRQIPPYPETRHYVKAVMAKYASNTKYAYDIKYATHTKYPSDIKNAATVKPSPENKRTAANKLMTTKQAEINYASNNAGLQTPAIANMHVENKQLAPNLAGPNLAERNMAEPNLAQPNLAEPSESNAADSSVAELKVTEPVAAEKVTLERTQYLPGTGLVIANEDFAFTPDFNVY